VKGLFTAFLVIAVFFGIYQFMMAGYGWFQMSTVVEDVATRELKTIADRIGQPTGIFEGDRFAKVREGILRGAEDAGVDLSPENVAVSVENNVLDVRLSWGAPMVKYQGHTYLELPMTMQRSYSLARYRP
jgi:hypothetical protein